MRLVTTPRIASPHVPNQARALSRTCGADPHPCALDAPHLAPFGVEAQHPDDFLLNQIDLDPIAALKSIKAMRARFRNPVISAPDLATTLERSQLPLVAARLREVQELI